MNNYNISLFGSSGLLGQSLLKTAKNFNNLIISTVPKSNLSSENSIQNILRKNKTNLIICTIAIPSNRRCLENPTNAVVANLSLPILIINLAYKLKIPIIIFSSHGVFKGKNILDYYLENDLPDSKSFYGALKTELEKLSLSLFFDIVTIIRLPSLYGRRPIPGIPGLCERIINDILGNKHLSISVNLFDSFTFADDVSSYLLGNIDKIIEKKIIHIANEGITSLYEFSNFCKDYLNSKSIITPVSNNDSQILCNAIRTTFFSNSLPPRFWNLALKDYLKELHGK